MVGCIPDTCSINPAWLLATLENKPIRDTELEILTVAVPLWLFSFSSFPSPAASNCFSASSAAVLFPR